MKNLFLYLTRFASKKTSLSKNFFKHPVLVIVCSFLQIIFLLAATIFLSNLFILLFIGFNIVSFPFEANSLLHFIAAKLNYIRLFFFDVHVDFVSELVLPATYRNIWGNYSVLLSVLDYTARCFPIILLFYLIIKFLKRIIILDHFNRENISLVKIVGFIIVLYHPFVFGITKLLSLFTLRRQVVAYLPEYPVSISYMIPDLGWMLRLYFILGILIILFAEAIKKGIKLQQENDLTV